MSAPFNTQRGDEYPFSAGHRDIDTSIAAAVVINNASLGFSTRCSA